MAKRTARIEVAAAGAGIEPLDYLLQVLRDEGAEPRERMEAAKFAAPYQHARMRTTIELGGTVRVVLRRGHMGTQELMPPG